jgi:hypothetical protein
MGAHRGVWQVGIAVLYLGLIVVLLQVLLVVRTIPQQQGSVWGARGQLLLFALFGVLVVGQALWGARNRVGSGVVAGVLTLVIATTHAAVVQVPRGLSSVWFELGLWSNATLPAMAWGGSLAALGAALYLHQRSRAEQTNEEPVAS